MKVTAGHSKLGRVPPKAQRRAMLLEGGWTSITNRGSGAWTHPDYGPVRIFTLAAAWWAERDRRRPPPMDVDGEL